MIQNITFSVTHIHLAPKKNKASDLDWKLFLDRLMRSKPDISHASILMLIDISDTEKYIMKIPNPLVGLPNVIDSYAIEIFCGHRTIMFSIRNDIVETDIIFANGYPDNRNAFYYYDPNMAMLDDLGIKIIDDKQMFRLTKEGYIDKTALPWRLIYSQTKRKS